MSNSTPSIPNNRIFENIICKSAVELRLDLLRELQLSDLQREALKDIALLKTTIDNLEKLIVSQRNKLNNPKQDRNKKSTIISPSNIAVKKCNSVNDDPFEELVDWKDFESPHGLIRI